MKKCVFILAIALLSVGAYARDFVDSSAVTGNPSWLSTKDLDSWCQYKAYPWTWGGHWVWDSIDVAKIKVVMDIGMWVSIKDCTSLKMKLNQIEVTKYSGSTTMKVKTNVPISFSSSWTAKNGFSSNSPSISFDPASIGLPADGIAVPTTSDVSVTVSMTVEKVDLSKFPGGTTCQEVGEITVKVTPTYNITIPGAPGC